MDVHGCSVFLGGPGGGGGLSGAIAGWPREGSGEGVGGEEVRKKGRGSTCFYFSRPVAEQVSEEPSEKSWSASHRGGSKDVLLRA